MTEIKIKKTIRALLKLFEKQNDLVLAFAGGVGIDGFIGSITPKHDDIDIDVFSKVERSEGLERTELIISEYNPKFNGIYFEFQLNNIKIEIGYVRIVKEYNNNFVYDAGEGIFIISKPLFLPKEGKIRDLTFNIFNPAYIVAEKIMLPVLGKKEYRQKDILDLNNLLKKINLKDV